MTPPTLTEATPSTPAQAPPAPTPAAAPAPPPRPLLVRLRLLVLELVKFGLVGGSGVAVNLLVFNLLLHGFGSGAMTATAIASCVAMGTNYLGFRFFAYRDRASRTKRQIALFFVFSGIGVAMESVLFYAAYQGAAMSGPLASNIAKAVSIVLASAFRFLVCRTWVFPRGQGVRRR
ncbi:GtrA family protein [Streptomyces alfalfae]|uniref:GtrA family protein n=1 Tax=Streptomyces alfalfae TaxID=1642299 RepID=A0A4Q2GKB2_9ACTN|nr:GtrA family protein [Streptomyces alfalfae]AYA21290.1 GtrA family protein [Streptomyces fradiae]QQC89588.1 GtrA family protein [Streptomyces alfalfae]QUI32028.1 GtrA family protein [Streptomyces alfalfae]RXX46237.1 GtrA family protein [Streptomyces alfalfae]RZM96410.1 GtrA family protein [Streptomyces alfalfae]